MHWKPYSQRDSAHLGWVLATLSFFQWNPFFVLSSAFLDHSNAFLDHSNAFLVHSRDISILSRKKNQLASLVFFYAYAVFLLRLRSFFSKASQFLPRASTNYVTEGHVIFPVSYVFSFDNYWINLAWRIFGFHALAGVPCYRWAEFSPETATERNVY